MPRKIRELKQMLRKAGWMQIPGGKGSHSKFAHPRVRRIVLLSGNDGADAKRAQEHYVKIAIEEARSQS